MTQINPTFLRRTVPVVCVGTSTFAVLHSILASQTVKAFARRRAGDRLFNGFYRLGFNGVALLTFGTLLTRFARLPDRTLYAVPWPWSLPLRVMQFGAIVILLDANFRIGIGRMSGVQGAIEFVAGQTPIGQNPAQGPQLEDDLSFRTGGSFQLCRHPNNLAPLVLWVFHPKMTVRFAAFICVSALYLVAGSVHEEGRLRAAYKNAYERYRTTAPFYLPIPR